MANQLTAIQKAVALLAKKEYSCHQLCIKLTNSNYNKLESLAAITALQNAGYLNDRRFISCFVRYKFKRGIGPEKILYELSFYHKIYLVDDDIVFDEFDFAKLALYLRIKKFGANVPNTLVDKARQFNYLRHKGFYSAQAHLALKHNTIEDKFIQDFNGVFL